MLIKKIQCSLLFIHNNFKEIKFKVIKNCYIYIHCYVHIYIMIMVLMVLLIYIYIKTMLFRYLFLVIRHIGIYYFYYVCALHLDMHVFGFSCIFKHIYSAAHVSVSSIR